MKKILLGSAQFGMNYGDDISLGDKFIHKEVEVKFSVITK